jgi:hypothetical protein
MSMISQQPEVFSESFLVQIFVTRFSRASELPGNRSWKELGTQAPQ